MATITKQTIRVDLTPGRVYPVLHVSQGDVGLEALEFYVYQNGQPFTIPSEVTAINIDGMTPVGVFSYPCTWTGNVVTAGLTATMTAERGIDICELALYDATNNKIGTCNFVIAVEESPYTNAHVSTSDMATIMAAASSAQQYELLAKSWAVGDTGIRTGEDTNNSEYWSEQSAINGERWAVGEINGEPVPPTDETHENNSKYYSGISESWAVGGTGQRVGEDTNNSKYYADQSRIEGNGLASVFSASESYSASDYVIYNGILYKFISDHAAGAWTGSDVSAVNLGDAVFALETEEPARHFFINGEQAVTRIANVAQTYITHANDFVYGGEYTALRNTVQQVGGKWQINCSTFAMLLAYGVTYENSAYQRGAGNNILDDECCTDLEMWDWFRSENEGQTGDYRFKYTYDLAKWCFEHGYCFEPNGDLSNIKPGDMLFMKGQTGSDGGISTFRAIDHSCIFGYWNNDNLYTVWEVGSLPSAQQYFKSNLEQNCVLVARFPMTNLERPIENIGLYTGAVSSDQNILQYVYTKDNFVTGKYYTLIAKLTNSANITDVYPTVYHGNTRLAGYDNAINKPDDDIYVIPFVPVETGAFQIRMNARESGITLPTTTLEWYNVVEGLHFGHERLSYARRARVSLQTGYSLAVNYLANDFLFICVGGTFATGTNNLGTLSGTVTHGNITPAFCICYPASGVTSNVEAYVYGTTLMVRNNTGSSITGDVYIAIPIYNK